MSTEAPPAPPAAPPAGAPPAAAPSAATQPFYADWLGADGALNTKSLDRLPDHLKGMRPTLEKYGKIEDALMGWQNQQMMAGKKALAPLPADAPAAVLAERKQLLDTINGVPADSKGYAITRPQDFPEQAWSQPAADNLAAWAHKHSVSPAAAKELMMEHGKITQGMMAEQQQHETNFWADQQKAFDGIIRQENIAPERASALVEKGAIALGLDPNDPETKLLLQGSKARLMAMRHAIATGESGTVQAQGSSPAIPDPSAAASDIQTNPANPLHGPYWNKEGKYSRAAQEAAVAKHLELLRLSAAKAEQGAKR